MALFLAWSYDDNNLSNRNVKISKIPHFIVTLDDSEQYNEILEKLALIYPNKKYGLYQLLNMFYPSVYHQNFDGYDLKGQIKFGETGYFHNDSIINELVSEFSFDIVEKLERNKYPIMSFSITMDYCYAIIDVINEIKDVNKKLDSLYNFKPFNNVKTHDNPFIHNYDEDVNSLLDQMNNVQI